MSSPPYADALSNPSDQIEHTGQGGSIHPRHYGYSAGQLAALREGDFDAAISSPPFSGDANMQPVIGQGTRAHLRAQGRDSENRDQSSSGNLGMLRATDAAFDAAISSPPFETTQGTGSGDLEARRGRTDVTGEYGSSDGQLGSESGDTFWAAAKIIVAQTFTALRPGGHAVWVVKSFIRDGELVDFPDQWRRLCESVGFVTLHEHRCWLVEDRGTQLAMDGNHQHSRIERKSFFRRLAERKGSPRIDFEICLCMEKPK